MRNTTWCLTLLAAAALAAPGWNAAAVKDEKDAAVKEVVKTDYKKAIEDKEGNLTKEMIEACILLKKDLDAEYAEISKIKAQFDALNKETTELGVYLKDNGGRAASDEYEAKVKAYNDKLPKLNSQLEAYTKMSAAYEAKTAKFDKECSGQPYYEDDYEEMKKKLGYSLYEENHKEMKEKPEPGK